ncbi:MAG TPA: electron transfer flavoprotein subunit alpha/FixB family protein [Gemmatimonadales bacterium]|jgi:electron transfer flavoprotein alpha subunit|nr:electron transfer flavoprotein subunit alpha/FixB family protein [Gemmatimonadales bacterium]
MAGNGILAVLEARDGALRKVSHEVLAAARQLASADGASVDALMFGRSAPAAGELDALGANRVLAGTHADFGRYHPDGFAATVASLGPSYRAIVFAATATGKDLAPRAAAKLGVGLVADVTGLAMEGGAIVATRPVYAGKVIQRVKLKATPGLVSIRPNTFEAARRPGGQADRVTVEEVPIPAFEARVQVTGIKAPEKAMLDVAEAPIVVSGGRGLKDPTNFALLEALADALGNTAVGASRAVVDAGWREHGAQVGQTGKTVSPGLYIAVGISGAIQHLAGMRTAKTIVAINRDKDAPIFKVADYGIVGDLFEVVPRLTEEIRKLRSEK